MLLVVAALLIPVACGDGDAGDTPEATNGGTAAPVAGAPFSPVRLVFIHHSVGEEWLADDGGGLGAALAANNYFVSDTNYGWGPEGIGDTTDIGDWYTWFNGPGSDGYTKALYAESEQNSDYSRLEADADPGGENEVIVFKSCFPNSALDGQPDDEPTQGDNPLRGEDSDSENLTVANAKGIYNDLLDYFATRRDKLFVVVTAPPQSSDEGDAAQLANARSFNTWLVEDWLDGYDYGNVVVFDFFNVLTTNGGDRETSDAGLSSGNHHRISGGSVEYINDQGDDFSAYDQWGDSHPTAAGGQKATQEFLGLLNHWYGNWSGGAAG